ncbi:MAG: Pyruvate, water dikinase [Candidatus Nomurabacteria bacterium GW2011_GWF2_43_8]|uniref:Pyruvate, water dikinase n=3 Tax=Candidatus Nomuraibacteriota TaxID=1752729 RepID=A0A0G1FS91_9BACT|nr:MAG: Pyruvate, water dikinase [Candidatus Nomurabacteria bacterium GW2011_GWA2_43_15]KKT19950.1 MAG: Pyruvate, water dikinase [Candidatus Nomurabacteria bacterium GW2011_GWB1_43_7]KKT24943.1 MAG: Pyruvate, water dikinase [Candidatus Nomurabacteria bacterium GW2011_GWF2_43_8]
MEDKIYDNSNIAESYAGITTPLTFSFARYIYQEVYRHFSRMMGVSNKAIQENEKVFGHMIEFIGYRIYYNLNSWYKMLSFFPAYKISSEFMEKMMGVEKSNTLKTRRNHSFFQKYFFYSSQAILQTIKIALVFLTLGWSMEKFSKYFKRVFSELNTTDLDNLNLSELKSLYETADTKLLARWKIPIANDFAVMVSAGLADKLFKKWLVSDEAYSYMAASVNKPLISLDPGNRMIKIAGLIQYDEKIRELFLGQFTEEKILKLLYEKFPTHKITISVRDYLKDFGTRMPNELKLESETLIENPRDFVAIIKKLVRKEAIHKELPSGQFQDFALINLAFTRKVFLRWLLRWAGNSIRRREEARFYRTLVFGFIRRIFLAIGRKMKQVNTIKNDRDIFYLTIEEVFDIIVNKKLNVDLASLIDQRKDQFKKWQNIEFPRRIETTKSITELEREVLNQQLTSQEPLLNKLSGRVASCPNNMQAFYGVALTLKSFNPSADFLGKILVTRQTDPGWTIVFPLLKGVVVERGGMLSHAAIVARELNIPCIVGVEYATEVIASGMNIKLDLVNGLIQKL